MVNDSIIIITKNKIDLLINDLQYIYKYKHIFNNTQLKIHNRHMSSYECHIIMHMVHWGEYWAVLKKHMPQWNA